MIRIYDRNINYIDEIIIDDIISLNDELILNGQIKSDFSIKYNKYIDEAYYYSYTYENEMYLYKIISKKNTDGIVLINGIHIFFDDMKGLVIRDKRPNRQTVQSVCNDVFTDTDWTFVSSVTGSNSDSFYHISYLEAFYKILEKWKCEFKLSVKFNSNGNLVKRVELKNSISEDHGKWFEYGDNLVSVMAEQSYSEVFTAFIGRGKGEETENGSFGRKIKFTDIEWKTSNGDPVDKPIGLDYVEIKEATKLYGYNGTTPRFLVVDFNDIEDEKELLQSTYEYALNHSRPLLQLKSKAYSNEIVEIGEIAAIIRPDLNIRYKTKIFSLKRDLISGIKDFEFGDSIIKTPGQYIKENNKKNEEKINEAISRFENVFVDITSDFWTSDSYDIDLLPDNEYGLPSGRYSFDKPINENPTKVTYMGAGMVLIANSKNPNGEWEWRSAITPNGIAGSEILSHSITANKLAADVGQSLDLSSNESINLTVQNTIIENKDMLKGEDGKDGQPGKDGDNWSISEDGYWVKNGVKTNTKAVGEDGKDGATGPKGDTGPQGPQGPQGPKGDTGEADYTQFRSEYESEINQLSDEISLRVKSSDYMETVDKLNGTITSIEQLSSQTTELVQTSSGFEQRFTKIESSIDDNQSGINEIKAVVSTGLDEYGNTYTEWGSTSDSKVRVGSDGIDMISNNQETMTLRDGEVQAKALYVTETIGFGNHTAQKYGTEFTIFSWNGG